MPTPDELIPWAALASPLGCVIFLYWALATGRLWTRAAVVALTKTWEDRLGEGHDRETLLQQANQANRETTREALDQARAMQPFNEVIARALAADKIKDKPES